MEGHQQLKHVVLGGSAHVAVRVIVASVLPFPRVTPVVARALEGHGDCAPLGLLLVRGLGDVHQGVTHGPPGVLYQQCCQEAL